MVKIIFISWFISWFIAGFISMIIGHLHDMRGAEFNKNYFNTICILDSFVTIVYGYISLIMILSMFLKERKFFTRLLYEFTCIVYRIANIGIKNKIK